MDVKEAVRTAKVYIADLYTDEEIVNLGLEEVVFEEQPDTWKVTIGFSRPWDQKGPLVAALVDRSPTARSYKVLRIHDSSGQVKSLTDRFLKDPA